MLQINTGSTGKSMAGIYIVLAELTEPLDLQVRSGRIFYLEQGFYAYVGSALSGLDKRIGRHLKTRKKLFWHIDYLLDRAVVCNIISAETRQKEECFIARSLGQKLISIPGFGCSDCRCPSHLFFSKDLHVIDTHVSDILWKRGLKPLRLFNLHPSAC
ncbi:MAG: GIY-YIG nuclease family protein [Dehalococcoidia bacterium]|nr:GIY-YIG nuclease family protein [Dehalococcoidia bacterium]